MQRRLLALVAVLFYSVAARAQSGAGGLTGFVKDQQGAVLPGVRVTARGRELRAPVIAVSDTAGYYRVQNLPPGTVTLTAELAGFATFKREGILMRAGSSFTVDIDLKVGTLAETVTVSGESPMVSTGLPTKTMTVDGDLLRAAPISPRRAFSDVLDMAPGVNSRHSDKPIHQSVGRVARRPHHERQDVGVRCISVCRSGHRCQPAAAGSGIRHALSGGPAQFSAVQQHQHRQPAVREGDDAVEPEARGDRALSVPTRRQYQRARARFGSNLLQRRRRRRVFEPVAVCLVEPAHDDRVTVIQQQRGKQI